jgi:opacity protein-like surface antigen
MKRVITLFTLVFAMAFTAVAQDRVAADQGSEEFFLGATVLQENVNLAYQDGGLTKVTDGRKSVGFTVGLDHYFGGDKTTGKAGVFAVGGEFDMAFNRGREGNDGNTNVAVGTGTINLTLKARNAKYIQPYAKVGAGVARADFSGYTACDTGGGGLGLCGNETSEVLKAGVGADWNLSKFGRYAIRTGVNYETTTFNSERQHNARGTVALVIKF